MQAEYDAASSDGQRHRHSFLHLNRRSMQPFSSNLGDRTKGGRWEARPDSFCDAGSFVMKGNLGFGIEE